MRALAIAVVSFGLALASSTALARTERFALIVGNDRGLAHEQALRYAEADARKVRDTLRDIGGFSPLDMTLLEGGDAATLRRALIDLNVRLRSARSRPDTQIVLFVYYSGHADVEDLHLGDSRLAIAEIAQLVRGSAADFRLLVLDACRSGVLTRKKGGHITQPFDIPQPIELSGEGMAFLTASADNEVAQESDELRGSFFTHALVSGLLGAADRDRDGNVVLDEAYQYAYENTLRASSRSANGLQHPTFFYDVRGQGQLVLTRPFAQGQRRGVLELPASATYLVFRDSGDGQVAAEVAAGDPARNLSLAPGTYFVRGRTKSHVLEGSVQVQPAQTTRVDPDALRRIEYAQLVRKGYAELPSAHAVELLAHARSPLPNADTPCYGALGGYRLDLHAVAWLVRAGFCASSFDTSRLEARSQQYELGLRAVHAFDLGPRLALDAGVGLGAVYMEQRFDARTRVQTRRSGAAFGELVLGLSLDVMRGGYVALDAAVQSYVLPMLDARSRRTETRAVLTGRVALGAGMRL
jgi:hypothetical protein